jgi:ribosomal protein S18 acetylase RimI-like enzyme
MKTIKTISISLICFLIANIANGQDLQIRRPILPTTFSDAQGHSIIIRETLESDFNAIKVLCINTFIHIYNLTTKEKKDAFQAVYDTLMAEELVYFHTNHQKMISLVAVCNDNIIGFLSANLTDVPHEMYGRSFAIAPAFQHQGVGRRMIMRCIELLPSLKRAICLTSKRNNLTPKIYEHFGGKRVENHSWGRYLYSNLNPSDYVGYEFDETALAAFSSRFPGTH